ncbi:hypothetical protein MB901379_03702 [Mycobacterium basiliense]|uniref:Uncharacterized protein n=1 Tax=Mycobacterium basiliense TaxID=2094119 RepID=A0A447GI94_9MYCO|nr:hypothetical protein MB901379_03702 [Mycobacterium basiliense]
MDEYYRVVGVTGEALGRAKSFESDNKYLTQTLGRCCRQLFRMLVANSRQDNGLDSPLSITFLSWI